MALVVLRTGLAPPGLADLGEPAVLVTPWTVYFIGTVMWLAHAVAGVGASAALQSQQGTSTGLCLLHSGICGTALANAGWFRAIEREGQSRASPYLNLTPIVGVIASALLLNEPLGWWHGAGLLLVIGGTRVGAVQRKVLPAG